jgi:PAS domain S-box-containing protein
LLNEDVYFKEKFNMISDLLENHHEEMLEFCNLLRVGIWITDGEGYTLLVNNESCNTGGLTGPEIVGRHMSDLRSVGFVEESISLKTIESGKPETIIQALGDGNEILASSQPVYRNGKIEYVITTERDITETQMLKHLLEEKDRENYKRVEEIEYLRSANLARFGEVIAVDPVSKQIVNNAIRVANLDTSVLLTGESGTGKEAYANLIYKNSNRVGKPFIKVNVAALSENIIESELFGYEKGAFTGADKNGKIGFFELANTGTIFLDEIGDLPLHLQPVLLRVIQEREVIRLGGLKPLSLDVRLICATNVDLKKAVAEGRFREDLYYRLAIMPIEVPPLRLRRMDIAPLAMEFMEMFNKEYKLNKFLAPSAIETLERYDWPGNVRELQNVVERVAITFTGDEINRFQIERLLYPKVNAINSIFSVPAPDGRESTLDEKLRAYEKRIIEVALASSANASEASRLLGIDKSTMSRRMKKYGIGPTDRSAAIGC